VTDSTPTLCMHCNSRIEYRSHYWPSTWMNEWVHVMGEGVVVGVRCTQSTKLATPRRQNYEEEPKQ